MGYADLKTRRTLVKLWETFDLASLLVGLLIGAVAAFLLRLQALKRLSLDIKKIGLNLGVEGFEEKPSGPHFGGNFTGDFAGRDMTKDQRSYKNTNDLYSILADDHRAKIIRSDHLRATDDSPSFKRGLERLSKGEELSRDWIEYSLQNSHIQQQIDTKLSQLERDGWKVRALRFDNISDGVAVGFEIERPYERAAHPRRAEADAVAVS
jgi:hypothetical protein